MSTTRLTPEFGDSISRVRLLDEFGRPLSSRLETTLISLIPKFQRHFVSLCDDAVLIDIFETTGRKLARREAHRGRIDRLQAYAWVSLRSAAVSHLRRLAGQIEQRAVTLEDAEDALDTTPATYGTPEDIERTILVRELLAHLMPADQVLCRWRMEGFSSEEIAKHLRTTPGAVDAQLFRIRCRLRAVLVSAPAPPSAASFTSLTGSHPAAQPFPVPPAVLVPRTYRRRVLSDAHRPPRRGWRRRSRQIRAGNRVRSVEATH